MPQIIFGWTGPKDIYDVLKSDFTEEEQKKIYNILNFGVNKKLEDGKPIRPNKGINKWTPDVYKAEKAENKQTFISLLYKTKFSAYNKINCLQKYVDIINCKYAVNLKINFSYSLSGYYTFILYLGDCSTEIKHQSSIEFDKINEYTNTWNRVKDVLKVTPKIYSFN